jgi:hypothetical protein
VGQWASFIAASKGENVSYEAIAGFWRLLMTPTRFITYISIFIMLVVMTTVSVNYIIDPYSIFGTRFFPNFGNPQERYLKIEYLKKNPNFNTFLIGSSLIGTVRTEDVDRNIPGANSYNLTLSQAHPQDIEKHTEWLLVNIPKLTHVIIELDWPAEYGVRNPGYAMLVQDHPDISGRSKFGFLFDYLPAINAAALSLKIERNSTDFQNILQYNMSKGYWSRPYLDTAIETDCNKYVANQGSFSQKNNQPKKLNSAALISDTLTSIERTKRLLEKKNVKLTLLLTPLNHVLLDTIDISDYEKFITELVKITDFYNFMYYNSLTKNDCNFYESYHYRPLVGELLIRSLAEQPREQSEIYRFVSKESLVLLIAYFRSNFEASRNIPHLTGNPPFLQGSRK